MRNHFDGHVSHPLIFLDAFPCSFMWYKKWLGSYERHGSGWHVGSGLSEKKRIELQIRRRCPKAVAGVQHIMKTLFASCLSFLLATNSRLGNIEQTKFDVHFKQTESSNEQCNPWNCSAFRNNHIQMQLLVVINALSARFSPNQQPQLEHHTNLQQVILKSNDGPNLGSTMAVDFRISFGHFHFLCHACRLCWVHHHASYITDKRNVVHW